MSTSDATYQFSNEELKRIRMALLTDNLENATLNKRTTNNTMKKVLQKDILETSNLIQRINTILAARTNGGI